MTALTNRVTPAPAGLRGSAGLVLWELLVVLAIGSIMAFIALYGSSALSGRAMTLAVYQEKSALASAEQAYLAQHSCYANLAQLEHGGYLSRPPRTWTVVPSAGACPAAYTVARIGGGAP